MTMFFQGILQEGIKSAIEQTKLVVSFVTGQDRTRMSHNTCACTYVSIDGESKSQQWEDEFLTDPLV